MRHTYLCRKGSYFTALTDCSANFSGTSNANHVPEKWEALGRIFQKKLNYPASYYTSSGNGNAPGEFSAGSSHSSHSKVTDCGDCWSDISWTSLFRTYYHNWCAPPYLLEERRIDIHPRKAKATVSINTNKIAPYSSSKRVFGGEENSTKRSKRLPKILVSRCLLGDCTAYHGGCSGYLQPGTPSHLLLCLLLASSSCLASNVHESKNEGISLSSVSSLHHPWTTMKESANYTTLKTIKNTKSMQSTHEKKRPFLRDHLKTSQGLLNFFPSLFQVVPLCPEVDLLGLPVPRPPLYLFSEEPSVLNSTTLPSHLATASIMSSELVTGKELVPRRFTNNNENQKIKVVVRMGKGKKEGDYHAQGNLWHKKEAIQKKSLATSSSFHILSASCISKRKGFSRMSDRIGEWWKYRSTGRRDHKSKAFFLDFSKDSKTALSFPSTPSFSSPKANVSLDSRLNHWQCLHAEEKERFAFPFFHGAFLKARSPSCGVGDARVYFSSPTNQVTDEDGNQQKILKEDPEIHEKKEGRVLCMGTAHNNQGMRENKFKKWKEEEDETLLRFDTEKNFFVSLYPTGLTRRDTGWSCSSPTLSSSSARSGSTSFPFLPRGQKPAMPYALTHGFFTTLLTQEEIYAQLSFSTLPSPMPFLPIVSEKTLKWFVSPEEKNEGETVLTTTKEDCVADRMMTSSFTPTSSWMSLLSFLHQVSCRFRWENSYQNRK